MDAVAIVTRFGHYVKLASLTAFVSSVTNWTTTSNNSFKRQICTIEKWTVQLVANMLR